MYDTNKYRKKKSDSEVPYMDLGYTQDSSRLGFKELEELSTINSAWDDKIQKLVRETKREIQNMM